LLPSLSGSADRAHHVISIHTGTSFDTYIEGIIATGTDRRSSVSMGRVPRATPHHKDRILLPVSSESSSCGRTTLEGQINIPRKRSEAPCTRGRGGHNRCSTFETSLFGQLAKADMRFRSTNPGRISCEKVAISAILQNSSLSAMDSCEILMVFYVLEIQSSVESAHWPAVANLLCSSRSHW
jgi:hypothetical protein